MPYKSREARRKHDRDYKCLVWRPQQKARAAERAEQERAHREFLWQQRLTGAVPMRLTCDLAFDDGERSYVFGEGTRIWVRQSGLRHLFERLRVAVSEAEPFTGVRAIPSTYEPEIVPEEPAPPKERLPSGY